MLQSVISAIYPLFKEDLSLSFAQIGLITLVYQMSASVFQPLMGLFFDKRPIAWSLPIGMGFTLVGIMNLAFATNLYWLLASVFIVGIVLGLMLHHLIYVKIIISHFGGTWKIPATSIAMIVLLISVSCILAVHAPAKRIRNMPITATINEL
jgi:MFS family permease